MSAAEYCENRTRGSGSSFFYAFLFLPAEQRRAMMALYAFCREIDDIADEVPDQSLAMRQLGFWREEVARVVAGNPQHPVGMELHWSRKQFDLDEALLIELIDGMSMDVLRQPLLRRSDLALYCYRVAGVVGLLSIEIFGYRNRHARDFAVKLGEALQLTNILRDVASDAAIGRIYFPAEDRIRHRLADQDFLDGNHARLRPLLREYGLRAKSLYREALALLPSEDRASLRPSIMMAAIYYKHLQRLHAVDFDIWQRPVRLSPLRKIWIAWRCWRHERHPERPLRLEF